MSEILNTVLEMSLYGSIAIALVILFRLIFKKVPKKTMILIWSIVAFRLICPFNFDTGLGIANLISQKQQTSQITSAEAKSTATEVSPASRHAAPDIPVNVRNRHVPSAKNSEAPKTNAVQETSLNIKTADVVCAVWFTGMAAFLLYAITSAVKTTLIIRGFRRKDGYLESDKISTPFTVGVIKPTICIPSYLDEGEKEYMLLHEKIHLKNHDPAIKCLALGILCIHWFNPVVWIAYRLLLSDLEMRCDEKVVDIMGDTIKKDYCLSLVNHSVAEQRFQPVSAAFARKTFGGMEVKMRIKNLLKYKKTPVITSVLLLAFASTSTFVLSSCASGKSDAKDRTRSVQETTQASLEALSAKLDNDDEAEDTTTQIEEEETEITKQGTLIGEEAYIDPDQITEDYNGIPVYFYEETRTFKDSFLSSYNVDEYINNLNAKEIRYINFCTDGVLTIAFSTDDSDLATFSLAPNVDFSSLEEFDEYYSMKTYNSEYLGFQFKPENEIICWPLFQSRDKENALQNEYINPEDVEFLNYPEASETDTGYRKVYTYDPDKKVSILIEYDKENRTVSCTDYMTGFPKYTVEEEDLDPAENYIDLGFTVEYIDGVLVVWSESEERSLSKEWKDEVLDKYGIEQIDHWIGDNATLTEIYLGYPGDITARGYYSDDGILKQTYSTFEFNKQFSTLKFFDKYYSYESDYIDFDDREDNTRSVVTDTGFRKTCEYCETNKLNCLVEYIADESIVVTTVFMPDEY